MWSKRYKKHSCPSGLRGCTQVALYSYSWVQIPPNALFCHFCQKSSVHPIPKEAQPINPLRQTADQSPFYHKSIQGRSLGTCHTQDLNDSHESLFGIHWKRGIDPYEIGLWNIVIHNLDLNLKGLPLYYFHVYSFLYAGSKKGALLFSTFKKVTRT